MNLLSEMKNSMGMLFKQNLNNISDLIKSIDMETVNERIKESSEMLQSEMNKLKKRFKNRFDSFVVEVPFNVNTSTISFKIEDNKLTVTTKTNKNSMKSESTTCVNIPSDVDVTNMTQKYDDEHKIMRFFLKKKSFEDEVIIIEEPIAEEVVEEKSDTTDEATAEEKESQREAMINEMLEMHNDGISFKKIAEHFGISERTVRRWLKAKQKE